MRLIRSFFSLAPLLAAAALVAGCAATTGAGVGSTVSGGNSAAYDAVVRDATFIVENQTCNPPENYAVYCGAFARVNKSGNFQGVVIKSITCPDTSPCRVSGAISTTGGQSATYATIDFVGELSREPNEYMRNITFQGRWGYDFPLRNFTLKFVPSMKWEGYMRLEWLKSESGKSSWAGLMRVKSTDPGNIGYWEKAFP